MKGFLLGTAARFYLAVNLKSVADLGISLPLAVSAPADEVIE